MRSRWIRLLIPLVALEAAAQPFDVGEGAPSEAIRQRFQQAYFRNNFSALVSYPPLDRVKRFGSTGLVQEFASASGTPGTRLALVKATLSDVVEEGVIDIFHVQAGLYSYYLSVGVNTAGYPAIDTTNCPATLANPCQFQLFDKNHALFVYQQFTFQGQNFSIKDAFYTRWLALGDIRELGPPVIAEQTITASSGVMTTYQTYVNGALYNITSGTLNGRLLAVKQPIFAVYAANGAHTAFLGLPTSEEVTLAGGRHRQTFEGGSIEYDPGMEPVVRLAVSNVVITPAAGPVRMNLGDSLAVEARVFAANGALLEARSISWSTSNSRVIAIQTTGVLAVLRAVGGGTASVTAVSEGKVSPPLLIFVVAPCCQVGEGAPTPAIQQAFADAVARNRLAVRVPASGPVRRIGSGYAQELQAAEPLSTARYLVGKPDAAQLAYVVAGVLLARFSDLGGLTGGLGYPLADSTPTGRQMFEGGALAGNPAFRVSGPILARWAALGYETGPAGSPVRDPESFLTFTATAGTFQEFRGGTVYTAQTGPLAGRAFFVGGLILARYVALGGPLGRLGMPAGEETPAAGRRRQEFEGGVIEYTPGDSDAREAESLRRPQVTATPSTVVAGGRVRLAAGGFEAGTTLRVSISGQPDFLVPTETGAYAWEVYVPSSAPSASVAVRAADVNRPAVAQGLYVVRSVAEAQVRLSRLRGDGQVGLPGARLGQPFLVALRDEAGNPLPGFPVRFTASPGARIEGASAVTDDRGEARAWLRLPAVEGVALATAEAARQVITFSARGVASTLLNYPRLGQLLEVPLGQGTDTVAQKGALLAAAASILRYHQNLGELPSPNGPADPALLNQFLKSFCVFDAQGDRICDGFLTAPGSHEQIVNLWRLGAFAADGVDVVVEDTRQEAIRDLLAQGVPVLLGLALTADGAPAGSSFVVAIGTGAGGEIVIHDPNRAFGRPSLESYLAGFPAASRTWGATVSAALRLFPRSPSGSGFLLASGGAEVELLSPNGPCGRGVAWPDVAVAGPAEPVRTPAPIRFRYCDGLQNLYQLDVSGQGSLLATLTDLSNPGNREPVALPRPASFRVSRPGTHWKAFPLETALSAAPAVNAASFTPELAPGGLAAVFGSGMWAAGSRTTVEFGGLPATVVSATPFQINAAIPLALGPGIHSLRVRSAFGAAEQAVELLSEAPALFLLDGGRAAAINEDGSINGPASPARRGRFLTLYCTGLGAVRPRGQLQEAVAPVTVVLEGAEVAATFAGLAPGIPGVYQVNLRLPDAIPPGLALRLRLRQGPVESQSALVAVQ